MITRFQPFLAHLPRKRIVLATAAFLALGGMVGAGHAENVVEAQVSVASVRAAALPMFTPSADAQFDDAFAPLDTPLADAPLPAGAVDMTAIEPASEGEARMIGSGVASFYGRQFAGRPTASGETFDPTQLTAAHRTLPFGSLVRVTNTGNGRSVVVRINDRGPYSHGREIDLSRSAAEEIGLVQRGHGNVELELLEG